MDAHRSLDGICLEHVLCIRETRTLTKDFTVQFKNTFYQILSQGDVFLYKKGKVEIRQLLNGEKIALFNGKRVIMKPLSEVESPIFDEKEVNSWKSKKVYIPPRTHPYKCKFVINKPKRDLLQKVI